MGDNDLGPEQQEVLIWHAMVHGAYCAMSDTEKARLAAWEADNVDGSGEFGTSDWPGWERILDRPNPLRHD